MYDVANESTEELSTVIKGMEQNLLLVASRTQLRKSLMNYTTNPSSALQTQMNIILTDAQNSIENFIDIHVLNLEGIIVASTNNQSIGKDFSDKSMFAEGLNSYNLGEFYFSQNNSLQVYLTGPLILNNQPIGVIIVESSTKQIQSVLDSSLVGESGEIFIVNMTQNGDALILNQVKYGNHPPMSILIPKSENNNPILNALKQQVNTIQITRYNDYRDVSTLIAVDYLPSVSWVLTVKIDWSEVTQGINYQQDLLMLTLFISAILILLSFYLSMRYIVHPVKDITELSEFISQGDLEHQVTISSFSEFNSLSRALNQMSSNLLKANAELKDSEEKLRQSQKIEAVGRLAGGIAHDFNNLLTAILGYTDLLEMEIIDDKSRVYLNEIMNASRQAKKITSQLLAFSRKQHMNDQVLDLNNVIEGIKELMKRLIPEVINIEFDLYQNPLWIYVDKTQIEQVILNLVINAGEAMPDGGNIFIKTDLLNDVKIKNETLIGNYAYISLKDEGVGIKNDDMELIFDPFYTTKVEGTGLGLSTVYGIVSQSNGRIEVYSEPQLGSEFRVYIPLTLNPPINPKQIKISPRISIEHLRDSKILIVEDDTSIKSLVYDILINSGLNPIVSKDEDDALKIAQTMSIDILITDVIMPKINGIDLSNRLTNATPNLKTLFITGYSKIDVPINENNILISKPFQIHEFLEGLTALVPPINVDNEGDHQ